MYKDKKFKVRRLEEIIEDLNQAKKTYGSIRRIFLADGNALVLSMDKLNQILDHINHVFPDLERVSVYAAPRDILSKSLEDLKRLKEKKLTMAYMGIESGCDAILRAVCKGVTSQEIITGGQKLVQAGITLSTMIISGLGGKEGWQSHAKESARVLNAIQPNYLSLLTLMVNESGDFYKQVQSGALTLLKPREVMVETRAFIEDLDLESCTFRSNHPSNYISLEGNLPEDKADLLQAIDYVMTHDQAYRPEAARGL